MKPNAMDPEPYEAHVTSPGEPGRESRHVEDPSAAGAARRRAAAVHYRMGIGFEIEARLDEAAEAYGMALGLDPGCEDARRRMHLLTAARGPVARDRSAAADPERAVQRLALREEPQQRIESAWADAANDAARHLAARYETRGHRGSLEELASPAGPR